MSTKYKQQRNFAIVIALLLLVAFLGVSAYFEYQGGNNKNYTIATVYYTDGTSRSYDSRNFVVGQTITDPGHNNAVVSKVQVEEYISVSWTDSNPLLGYSVSGADTLYIKDNNPGSQGNILYQAGSAITPLSPLPTLINGGTPVALTSSTITTTELESLYTGWKDGGSYIYQVINNLPVTLTLNFKDGSASASASAPLAFWKFTYVATGPQIISLSVTFGIYPSYA